MFSWSYRSCESPRIHRDVGRWHWALLYPSLSLPALLGCEICLFSSLHLPSFGDLPCESPEALGLLPSYSSLVVPQDAGMWCTGGQRI